MSIPWLGGDYSKLLLIRMQSILVFVSNNTNCYLFVALDDSHCGPNAPYANPQNCTNKELPHFCARPVDWPYNYGFCTRGAFLYIAVTPGRIYASKGTSVSVRISESVSNLYSTFGHQLFAGKLNRYACDEKPCRGRHADWFCGWNYWLKAFVICSEPWVIFRGWMFSPEGRSSSKFR